MAETGGPVSRSVALAMYLKDKGLEVATCIAEDVNYKRIDGITNYYLDVPMPMGAPVFVGKNIFPIVQKLGITSKKTVSSFDEVLFLTGNLNYRYLKKSIESLRKAIYDYKPDVVYSEFNISAAVILSTAQEKQSSAAAVSYYPRWRQRPETMSTICV